MGLWQWLWFSSYGHRSVADAGAGAKLDGRGQW